MTYVDEFRKRRYQRLKSRGLVEKDAILEFRKRREARLDAGEEEEEGNKTKVKVKGHGNTRLPFGLCQREGINIEKGWTPTDAWNALEGKGYNAKEEYKGLKEGKPAGNSKRDRTGEKTNAPQETPEQIYTRAKKEYKDSKEKIKNLADEQKQLEKEKNNIDIKAMSQRWKIERIEYHIKQLEDTKKEIAGRTKEQLQKELDTCLEEYKKLEDEYDKLFDIRPARGTKEREEWDKWIESHGGHEAYYKELSEKLSDGEGSIENKRRKLKGLIDRVEQYGEDCGISQQKRLLENENKILSEYNDKLADKDREIQKNKEEQNKENEKRKVLKEQYTKAVKGKFPSYDDCTTKEDILERFNCEFYFKNDGEFEITEKADLSLVRSTAKYLSNMMEKFPQMKGKVGNLKIMSFVGVSDVKVDHTYGYSYLDHEVCLNEKFYSDPKKLKESYDMCLLTRFHPEGTTYDSIVIHEYGHQIDNMLSKELRLTEKSGKQINFSTQVMKEVKKRVGKNMDEIKKSVSRYSIDNKSGGHLEFFAEALSEYVTSEHPREIAMMVGEITERYLKQIDGGTV